MEPPKRIAIVGAGAMGHGLAVHCARYGLDVTLIDHRESNLDRAAEQMLAVSEFLNEHELIDRSPDQLLDSIRSTTDRAAGVTDADLVLETITEDLDAKRELFAALVGEAPESASLASNTSGIPISDIAAGAPEAADRIVGCHWWYPPYLLEPVEVVRGEESGDEHVARVAAFVESVGRRPIRVERDVPGFVWNRIQFAIFRECLHLVETGVASAEDVNAAIRDGYAVRTAAIGPFETMDLAGLDLVATVGERLYPELANDEEPQATLTDRVAKGMTGLEVGEGIFEYEESPEAVTARRDRTVAAIRDAVHRERNVERS